MAPQAHPLNVLRRVYVIQPGGPSSCVFCANWGGGGIRFSIFFPFPNAPECRAAPICAIVVCNVEGHFCVMVRRGPRASNLMGAQRGWSLRWSARKKFLQLARNPPLPPQSSNIVSCSDGQKQFFFFAYFYGQFALFFLVTIFSSWAYGPFCSPKFFFFCKMRTMTYLRIRDD